MIVDELKNFRGKLMEYLVYRRMQIEGHKKLTKEEDKALYSIYNEISVNAGKYAPLVKEYTGLETIKTSAGPQDVWNWACSFETNTLVVHALDNCVQATGRTIGKLEDDIAKGVRDEQGNVIGKPQAVDTQEKSKDISKVPSYLFDRMQLHPRIRRVSKSLFNSGHYAEAIFAAFKAVNNFTKKKAELSIDGKDLMAKTFNKDKPIIKLNKLSNQSEQDEQEGFMFLFMGAMVEIRNPKAHEDIRQIDPYKALEYLSFASLLMRRATEGKLETENK